MRPIVFFTTLLVMMTLETLLPKRQREESRASRNGNNLLLGFLNSMLLAGLKFVPMVSAVGAAEIAERLGWGLFSLGQIPLIWQYAITLVLFDLVIYWQHVATHKIPMLWALHKVHHADHDLDASSALRFHPAEIVLSMVLKSVVAIGLGSPAGAVLLFEVILNACAIFNHSNLQMPTWLDRLLRYFVVTPDMHRVHHSVVHGETNSNYGFNLPWWDVMFRTYKSQPEAGHLGMRLGIAEYPDSQDSIPIWSMLKMPFVSTKSAKHASTGHGATSKTSEPRPDQN